MAISEIWARSHLGTVGRTLLVRKPSRIHGSDFASQRLSFHLRLTRFLVLFCASLANISFPCQALPDSSTHMYTHTHACTLRQVTKALRGSERSPSHQVFQDYLDVMNKIVNSIEAFRTNENHQCVTQLHFSFVCLSLEQNRFYK